MSSSPINPALLLESFGGFSESRYLGLFQAVNREEVAGALRGLNATEIAFEGKSFLALDVILAPLDAGILPRIALEQVAENTDRINDLGDDLVTPLTRAYCASISLYARMAAEGNQLCSAESAALSLNAASKRLGRLWGVELLKFYLWCFTLRFPRSAEHSPEICLAFSFLLICDLLESMAGQLALQVAVKAGPGYACLAEWSADELFQRELKSEFDSTLGLGGKVARAINQARAAVLGQP